MAAYWKKRYQEASSQLQATSDENTALLSAMDGAGLELPEEIRQVLLLLFIIFITLKVVAQ